MKATGWQDKILDGNTNVIEKNVCARNTSPAHKPFRTTKRETRSLLLHEHRTNSCGPRNVRHACIYDVSIGVSPARTPALLTSDDYLRPLYARPGLQIS